MKLSNISNKIIGVALNVYNLPLFRELRNEDYISYGYNNTYPQYLIDMFNQSAVHNAIVTGKVNYITGRGLSIENGQNKLFINPNPYEDIDNIFHKVATDYEVINGYAYEVVKNKQGFIDSIYHMDFSRLRLAIDKKGYWYSTEWTYINTDGERVKKYNPKKVYFPKYKSGAKDVRSVYVFAKYRPDFGDYPLPDYVGAMSAIETSVEISNYHLNNIKNGFAAGTMINLFNGIPEEEEKNEIVEDYKAKATGSNKAGEVFINFAEDKEHGAEVLPMQPNNLDKQFDLLTKSTQDTIFIGHKITNGGLFGVKTEGQLGGTNKDELVFAYEQFKETYIKQRQEDLLFGLNYLLNDYDPKGATQIEIKELRPILPDLILTEATILKYVPDQAMADYIKGRYGIETIVPVLPPMVTPQQQAMSLQLNAINYFEKVGKVYNNYTLLASNHGQEDGKFDYDSEDSYQFVSGLDKTDEKILATISELPTSKPSQIARILDLEETEVIKRIDHLANLEMISIEKIGFKILSGGDSALKQIGNRQQLRIVYSYQTRLDAPELIGESRDYCKRLTALSKGGKRWTRSEIEGLKNEMPSSFLDNQNVWLYRGGWYREPGSDVSVPFCRHRWVQEIIMESK